MNALSLFSGIGGIDLGLERAGIRVVCQCEADEWRRAVLATRFPGVPCSPDVREVAESARSGRLRAVGTLGDAPDARHARDDDGVARRVDLIAGGFPCQDVSVAGRRAGLAGERTGLWWEFHRIIDALRPRWVLLENVPGLLSSNHGRDFAAIIDALDGIGYVGAWRVLDSRFFGVPQRRRRVFILAADARVDRGADRCAEVLAVGTRCSRDHAEGAASGQGAADGSGGRAAIGGAGVSPAVTSKWSKGSGGPAGDEVQNLIVAGDGPLIAATLSSGGHPNSNMPGRRKEDDANLVAFGHTQGLDHQASEHLTPTLRKQGGGGAIGGTTGVRRLTPRECERLQGFPDDWTLIEWDKVTPKGKVRRRWSTDNRRYAALGDAVTVNVAEWIARRIVAADRGAS